MDGDRRNRLAALRADIRRLERVAGPVRGRLSLGDPRLDSALGGGLPLGQWHEIGGEGAEAETGAAPAAFAARLAAALLARPDQRGRSAVWILRRDDLFPPGLAGLGLPADRLVGVCARDEAEALAVAEDALASPGVGVVLAEVGAVDLTAGRRLQLACEARGGTGLMLLRRPFGGGTAAATTGGTAAATCWRVSPAASAPGPGGLGLGAPRWRLRLVRSRGGRTGDWRVEAGAGGDEGEADVAHPLRLVAELGDRDLAAPAAFSAAG
ncbi:protein imuA [Phenylobacterium sp.]|uniref:ImuA family protein n=1 Tax=Phenylobacterium sp. TaxID=1871053 RepID=UPI0025FCAD3D|nr:protein imuA [Phenylobacterium sp.]